MSTKTEVQAELHADYYSDLESMRNMIKTLRLARARDPHYPNAKFNQHKNLENKVLAMRGVLRRSLAAWIRVHGNAPKQRRLGSYP